MLDYIVGSLSCEIIVGYDIFNISCYHAINTSYYFTKLIQYLQNAQDSAT